MSNKYIYNTYSLGFAYKYKCISHKIDLKITQYIYYNTTAYYNVIFN